MMDIDESPSVGPDLAWLRGQGVPSDGFEALGLGQPPAGFTYPEPPSPPHRDEREIRYEPIEIQSAVEEDLSTDDEGEESDEEQAVLDAILGAQHDSNLDPEFSLEAEANSSSGNDFSDADLHRAIEHIPTTRGRRGRTRGVRNGQGQSRGKRKLSDVESAQGSAQKARKRGRPSRKYGPRQAIEPSSKVQRLLTRATAAHLRGDSEEAIECVMDIVEENPEVWAAHSLYSEILQGQRRIQDSLKALEYGSAFVNNPATLWDIARRMQALESTVTKSHSENLLSLLSRIIGFDSKHTEARKKRMQIYFDQGHYGRAAKEGFLIVKESPWDLDALQQLANAAAKDKPETRETMPETFEATIEYFQQAAMIGEENMFDFHMLNVYMEILYDLKRYDVGATKLRQLSRWLLGREDESFWDTFDDDREWDIDDGPRRVSVSHFMPGKHSQDSYGSGLPLELRTRLGLYRLHLGQDVEAKHHFAILHPNKEQGITNVSSYADLFVDVADEFRQLERHAEAIEFYRPLLTVPEADNHTLHEAMAFCYSSVKDFPAAAESLQKYLQDGPNLSAAHLQLAEIYEFLGHTKEARWQARQVKELKAHWVRKEPVLQRLLREEMGLRPVTEKSSSLLAKPNNSNKALQSGESAMDSEEHPTRTPKLAGQPTVPQAQRRGLPELRPLRAPQSTAAEDATLPKLGRMLKPKRQIIDSTNSPHLNADIRSSLQSAYSQLLLLQDAVDDNDEEAMYDWQRIAATMIEHFTSVQMFYRERYRHTKWQGFDRRSTGIEYSDDALDRYHNISFDDWLALFCRTALVQAKLGTMSKPGQHTGNREVASGNEQQTPRSRRKREAYHNSQLRDDRISVVACWVTLDNADNAQPFNQSAKRIERLRFVSLACAIILDDEKRMCDDIRYLIKSVPNAAEPLKLYNSLNRLFASGKRTWVNSGPHQKYILRLVKGTDFALLDETNRKLFSYSDVERRGWTNNYTSDGNPYKLEELNPSLFALHGHMLSVGGAGQNAMYYYFRALALVPDDPIINLCIANCYVEHALKRLCDNRTDWYHHGLAFFNRYYDIRIKSQRMIHKQEAEFNRGRFWFYIGLQHLAVPCFEKVIEMHEAVQDDQNATGGAGSVENFAPEAAFALSTILSLSGNVSEAKRLRERFLVI